MQGVPKILPSAKMTAKKRLKKMRKTGPVPHQN
jgi:hypothetical protein